MKKFMKKYKAAAEEGTDSCLDALIEEPSPATRAMLTLQKAGEAVQKREIWQRLGESAGEKNSVAYIRRRTATVSDCLVCFLLSSSFYQRWHMDY